MAEGMVRAAQEDIEFINEQARSLNGDGRPRQTQASILHGLVECWRKAHCPQCGMELARRDCTQCNGTERL